MRLDEALYQHLVACPLAPVVALRQLVGDRIYPVVRPANCALPAVIYDLQSGEEEQAHSGGIGIVTSSGQITAEAIEYAPCRELAGALKAALEAPTQRLGDLAVYRVLVTENSTPDYDNDTQSYVQALSLTVAHSREG